MKKASTAAAQAAEKKKKGKKTALKVICIVLSVFAAFAAAAAAATAIGSKGTIETARSFDTVSYENQLVPEKDENGYWSFTADRPFKIVQLTDVHIGAGFLSLAKDKSALNCVAAMLKAEKPDFVVVTGDVSYPVPFQAGTFNNKTSAEIFAELMERLGIYWTMSMGNHDTEAYSFYSRDEIGDFYEQEQWKHCLFEKGPEDVDGCGNQVINVKNSKGLITQSLFVFDSHSYTDGDIFGMMWKYDNIHQNQVQWYSYTLEKLNAENDKIYNSLKSKKKSDIKSLAFFHIPLVEYRDAWLEYAENGYKDTENAKLIYGSVGEGGKYVYCGIHEDDLFETMLDEGSTKGIFVGHDHKNNFAMDYKGIKLIYGLSVDYLAYPGINKLGSQRGCTVITVMPNGSFSSKAENYYQDKYPAKYEKEAVTMQEAENYDR